VLQGGWNDMGLLLGAGLTAIVIAMGAGITLLTGLLMGVGTAMVTVVIGFIAFLMILI
jgi:hypothetical protein